MTRKQTKHHIVADKYTMTGTTDDGRMVFYARSLNAWLDDETGLRVQVASITWIDLDECTEE